MGSKKSFWWLPMLIVFTLIIGFVVGNYFSSKPLGRKLFVSSGNKIDLILDIIENEYVDSVDMNNMVESVIPKIIGELDPHSVYIPAEELQVVNDDIEGHFSGIGVQFWISKDTVVVANVIAGGPSEKVGLLPGDRIVTINDSLFVGQEIDNDKVMKTLRGKKGTSVTLGIKRFLNEGLQNFEIIRGDVPVNTIDVAYSVQKGIGFIKINKFGKTTYNEFIIAMSKLLKENCTSFIVDLRGNPGGPMETAVNIVNEFLPQGQLIVYAEGKAFSRNDIVANGTGTCQDNPVVILMDEFSASASEIIAGAIQDSDRGLIVGRRSFAKGLVQNQIPLSDKSALRLTIARYYTPSGRCIQKEYELGKSDQYEMDLVNRYTHGELVSADSIKFNGPEYLTRLGRTVYGGGGIMPDIFVPIDTSEVTSYYSTLINHRIIHDFAFQYSDQNRNNLSKLKDYHSMLAYLKKQPLLEGVVSFAESNGIRRRPVLINISGKQIEKLTQACIIRNQFGDDGFYPVFLENDPMIVKAIEAIKQGKSFPVAPIKSN